MTRLLCEHSRNTVPRLNVLGANKPGETLILRCYHQVTPTSLLIKQAQAFCRYHLCTTYGQFKALGVSHFKCFGAMCHSSCLVAIRNLTVHQSHIHARIECFHETSGEQINLMLKFGLNYSVLCTATTDHSHVRTPAHHAKFFIILDILQPKFCIATSSVWLRSVLRCCA